MTFTTREAAVRAYDQLVKKYYGDDTSALRRKIEPHGKRYSVAVYCGKSGHFLTYL